MLTQTNNNIQGVLAANDGLGNAAISALKSAGLKPIPVTGQDATAQGVQNILSGWQCMTVYKSIKTEADAAATVADGILHAKPINTKGKTVNNGMRNVPSVLAEAGRDHQEQLEAADLGRVPEEVRRLHGRVREVLLDRSPERAGRHRWRPALPLERLPAMTITPDTPPTSTGPRGDRRRCSSCGTSRRASARCRR